MKTTLIEKLKSHIEKLRGFKRNKEARQKDAINKRDFLTAGTLEKEIYLIQDEITDLMNLIY